MSSSTASPPATHVPAGAAVIALGTIGPLLALVPLATVQAGAIECPVRIAAIAVGLWGVFMGGLVTYLWAEVLHDRVAKWSVGFPGLPGPPPRLPWLPNLVGGFERLVYTLLLAFDVESGATFIGVWVAMKMAGGWQQLGSSAVARATFTAGLLGNAMSILYGISAGTAVRILLASHAAA